VVTLSAAGHVETHNGKHDPIPAGTNVLSVTADRTSVTSLEVEVADAPWVRTAVQDKQAMLIRSTAEPCSFCFCSRLKDAVGGPRLGFPDSTIQWGVDGTIATRKLRIAPFVSPGSHNLDHVDFVLLRLREANGSTLMQYQIDGNSLSIFGKVCLNPVFRNERHLPVETSLTNQLLQTVTIDVLNPDLTPYHFHNAEWSLSLSFIP
jgi:hypothetical protein